MLVLLTIQHMTPIPPQVTLASNLLPTRPKRSSRQAHLCTDRCLSCAKDLEQGDKFTTAILDGVEYMLCTVPPESDIDRLFRRLKVGTPPSEHQDKVCTTVKKTCHQRFQEAHANCCHCGGLLPHEYEKRIAWGHCLANPGTGDAYYVYCNQTCADDHQKLYTDASFTICTGDGDALETSHYKTISPIPIMYNGEVGVVARGEYAPDGKKVVFVDSNGKHTFIPQPPPKW